MFLCMLTNKNLNTNKLSRPINYQYQYDNKGWQAGWKIHPMFKIILVRDTHWDKDLILGDMNLAALGLGIFNVLVELVKVKLVQLLWLREKEIMSDLGWGEQVRLGWVGAPVTRMKKTSCWASGLAVVHFLTHSENLPDPSITLCHICRSLKKGKNWKSQGMYPS